MAALAWAASALGYINHGTNRIVPWHQPSSSELPGSSHKTVAFRCLYLVGEPQFGHETVGMTCLSVNYDCYLRQYLHLLPSCPSLAGGAHSRPPTHDDTIARMCRTGRHAPLGSRWEVDGKSGMDRSICAPWLFTNFCTSCWTDAVYDVGVGSTAVKSILSRIRVCMGAQAARPPRMRM